MEIEGTVKNGVVVPDAATSLPEGTRVKISTPSTEAAVPFGQRYIQFKGAAADLPTDLAKQHEHYRLGTPKR